jgi:hypothetical protein
LEFIIVFFCSPLDNDDTNLGYKVHNGVLSVLQTYTETMSVNIPHAIFGDFYIIVMTDSRNAVFENAAESDNALASTVISSAQ